LGRRVEAGSSRRKQKYAHINQYIEEDEERAREVQLHWERRGEWPQCPDLEM
jgi:hypothetical protein